MVVFTSLWPRSSWTVQIYPPFDQGCLLMGVEQTFADRLWMLAFSQKML